MQRAVLHQPGSLCLCIHLQAFCQYTRVMLACNPWERPRKHNYFYQIEKAWTHLFQSSFLIHTRRNNLSHILKLKSNKVTSLAPCSSGLVQDIPYLNYQRLTGSYLTTQTPSSLTDKDVKSEGMEKKEKNLLLPILVAALIFVLLIIVLLFMRKLKKAHGVWKRGGWWLCSTTADTA